MYFVSEQLLQSPRQPCPDVAMLKGRKTQTNKPTIFCL